MSDIFIETSSALHHNAIVNKPLYLIKLNNSAKSKEPSFFISLTRPTILNGFVETKGIFIENLSSEEISKNYSEILTSTSKDLYVEMLFPWHRISSIKNLIFKAK